MTNSLTPSGTGFAEAATKFEALLAGNDPVTQTPKAEAAPRDSEVLTTEPLAEDSEDETLTETADEAVDDSADEEEATADVEDGEEDDSKPEIQLVTVKIDGKEEQIPLEEAIRGYQRHADYSRSMNQVSQEKKALEAELTEIKTERAQYAELLTALESQLAQSVDQEPDWERLYSENPLEYVRQKDLWRDRRERIEAINAEKHRLGELHAREQAETIANVVSQSKAELQKAVPEWKDKKRWEQDRAAIREYGNKLGFSDEELAQAYDHRAVLALYKSMKYDALMAKRPQPQQKSNAPKVVGGGNSSNAPPTKTKSAVSGAKQRLAKTGKLGDAAFLFEKLL